MLVFLVHRDYFPSPAVCFVLYRLMFYPPLLGVWKGMVVVCRKIFESSNLWHHWCRRVHIACRRLLPLETPAVWPLADGWELGWQSSPSSQHWTICLVSESPCLDCANTIYEKYLCSFWESGILVCSRQSVPRWPDPDINVGCWVSNELPWVETRHTCCIFAAGGRVCSVWPLVGGRQRKKTCM